MKKLRKKPLLLLVILSVLLIPQAVFAEETVDEVPVEKTAVETVKKLTVYANGASTTRAEEAYIEFTVPIAAKADPEAEFNKIQKEIAALGIPNENNFFYPFETYNEKGEVTGTVLDILINITDMKHANPIIKKMMSLGADPEYSIEFAAKANDEAYEAALINASKNAKVKAARLAKAFDVKLEDVIEIEEQAYYDDQYYMNYLFFTYVEGVDLDLSLLTVDITATLKVTYSF